MQKIYERINWENEPSIQTPLNEDNLNKMDYAVDQIDNRVVDLYGYETRVAEIEATTKAEMEAAKVSEENAKTSEDLARSYAIGTGGEVRKDDDTDNAKFYKEESYKALAGNVIASFSITPDGRLEYTKTFYGDDADNHFNFRIVEDKNLEVEIYG